jgi:hypothetical protein
MKALRKVKHFSVVLIFACGWAQDIPRLKKVRLEASPGEIRGAVMSGEALYTWGDGVHRWDSSLKHTPVAAGKWGEGGCIADVNGDGRRDLVLQRGAGLGELVWLEAPTWRVHKFDDEIEMPDCLEATLFDRRGILMIHRGMQVRFYEWRADKPAMREIYSIYTPSRQAGLALADVDLDGRPDILCGNYWIQSPARFDLPWHIFAIDTWFEEPLSASMRLLWLPGRIRVAVQREMEQARAAVFRPTANVKELWSARALLDKPLRRPALLFLEPNLLIFEDSRLLVFREMKLVYQQAAPSAHSVFPKAHNRLLLITRNSVEEWHYFWRK